MRNNLIEAVDALLKLAPGAAGYDKAIERTKAALSCAKGRAASSPVRRVSLKDIEARMRNDEEAHTLLDLVNAEFTTDPASVACFDARTVDRVRICVAKRKVHERRWG